MATRSPIFERTTAATGVSAEKTSGSDSRERENIQPSKTVPKKHTVPTVVAEGTNLYGSIDTINDVQLDGNIEGNIRAHLLTVGESATVKGEIMADDVVINGRVIGRVRGLKVRLTSTARIEGDIVHKTIAIESGAHFEGSVQRQDDPLADTFVQAATTVPNPVVKQVGVAAGSKEEFFDDANVLALMKSLASQARKTAESVDETSAIVAENCKLARGKK